MLGLGFATLTPLRGGAAIVLAAAGARLAGVLVQALPSYHPLSSATITTSHYLPVPQSPPIYLWCARTGGALTLPLTCSHRQGRCARARWCKWADPSPHAHPNPSPSTRPNPNPNPDPNPNLVQVGDGEAHGTAEDPMILSDVFVRGGLLSYSSLGGLLSS